MSGNNQSEPVSIRKYSGKSGSPTAGEKKRIAEKLFSRPRVHHRYTRLSEKEQELILTHAVLTIEEARFFSLRCSGKNLAGIASAMSFSVSYAKKLAQRVEKSLEKFVEGQ